MRILSASAPPHTHTPHTMSVCTHAWQACARTRSYLALRVRHDLRQRLLVHTREHAAQDAVRVP